MTRINSSVSIPASVLTKGGQGIVRVDGHEINVKVRHGTSSDIVFLFHGAVGRDTREIPIFQAFLPSNSRLTQVSISDDSLFHSPDALVGFYLGNETLPLSHLLPKVIDAFCIALESKNPPLFVGGSSGGYAALYYSNLFENSTAIVANPQTSIETYRFQQKTGVDALLRWCWTRTESAEALADKICLDLSEPYSVYGKNRVVYLQNSADRKHLHTQMGRFVDAIHHKRWKNFTSKVGFWGKLGHSASIPYSYISGVVDLISQHPYSESDELLQLPFFNQSSEKPVANKSGAAPGLDEELLRKNELINKSLLI